MSVLEWQCRELRKLADKLGNEKEVSVSFVRVLVIPIMREAADTIESLRNSLNEVADRWANAQIKAENYAFENVLLKIDNGTRWHELFGTPERAARTLAGKCGDCCECVLANACEQGSGEGCLLSDESNSDALLEWLRGDAE